MKKYFFILCLLVSVISITAVSAGLFDVGGLFGDETHECILTVESEDTSMSGIVHITEFRNIKENYDGTYDASQFYKTSGVTKGNSHDVKIKDGKAEYKLHNDTEFFIVEYYITDIKPNYGYTNESAPVITVEYLFDGESILSSSETAYVNQCDVSFGGQVYSIKGDQIQLNIDIPELDWISY